MRLALASTVACVSLLVSTAAIAQTLKVWDNYTEESQSVVVDELNRQFEAGHPGVTIERTARTFSDMVMILRLAVSSGDGPVVTHVNQGAGDMGAMVKERLLLPLDAYADKYGWGDRQSAGALMRNRWSDDGQFGAGALYGISGLAEMVGVYYNAKILADAGVQTPITSLEQFEAALATLKEKGVVPIMIGAARDYMLLHLFAAVSEGRIPAAERGWFDDLIYGRGGTWNKPAIVEAARQLVDWADKGYFFPGFEGMPGLDTVPLFQAGQAAFLFGGTWLMGDMAAINPDIHFMAMPGLNGDPSTLVLGGTDLAWGITNAAKDDATRDLAAQYIDFMTSEATAQVWLQNNSLPASVADDPESVNASAVLGEARAVWASTASNNALGHYPDWASPTMYKTMSEGLQVLITKGQSPEAFIESLDADYSSYLASKGQ